ncbi:MAG TPA: TrmH family RNA methyltransferase [Streptosporangiaceae bacterium]|nr:TrmH family RNA methyltransferase [Streptosporangiaceae bacterium]
MRDSGRDLLAAITGARQDSSLAVLEGFHALKHALRFGAQVEWAVTEDPALLRELAGTLAPDLRDTLASLVTPVDREVFRAMTASTPVHTKVIAVARRPPAPEGDPLPALAADGPVVLLEDPRHLGNVGAVVRVAAAAGACGVTTTGSSDPWDPAALRGSAGLHYAVPVWRSAALPPAGSTLVALDPAGRDISEVDLPAHGVFAFGTERAGLSAELSGRASLRVRIPMRAGVSSLNLATSVAVVLYALRLRAPAGPGPGTAVTQDG